MTCGIYQITNAITGKVYVGASQDIKARFSQHKSTLNSNTHRCAALQEEWNLYGQEAFSFSIIQEVELEELATIERSFIQKYNDLGICYNMPRDYHCRTERGESLERISVSFPPTILREIDQMSKDEALPRSSIITRIYSQWKKARKGA